ncbi:peroxide stress protein YaaA [Desulfogranum marinum]|uniref:peroxide stress protein YaaA n=1 Tax=Desulfogranum marinum TaxID=453220 RepID=UPI0019628981|nr:peroxide stress protein YaaA [Desulfogranum marinum]MBM9511669.1 peroxide stress protein YaaA [Desulfogranum marinum]
MFILSPSKGQDFDTPVSGKPATVPVFLDNSQKLIDLLREYSVEELRDLMQISEKIAQLNVDRYQSFSQPFTKDNAKQAIFAFTGDVYRGIASDSYSAEDLQFAQEHMRILSGLYGCLRPLDLIQPYRLEMKTRLANDKGPNLYTFWGNKVAEAINTSAANSDSPILFNLASVEYSKVITRKILKIPVVDILFQEEKEGKLRTIAVFAKRARGLMADYMIKQRVTTRKGVQAFTTDKYAFAPHLSDDKRYVFTRPQP